MRPVTNPRTGGLACALFAMSLTAAAAAPAAAEAAAPSFDLADSRLAYGERAVARGAADRALAGRRVSLELRRKGTGAWQELAATTVGADGRYRVRGFVPRSGSLRVRVADHAETSAERSVRVRAGVRVARRKLHVTAGRRAKVSGTVRPGVAGHVVALQVHGPRGWKTIDRDRTGSRGGYALADRRRATMSAAARIRVSAAGVAPVSRRVGRLNVYRVAHASWYGPGLYGNPLGCGGRLYPGRLGVAHKSLPCGTKVTLRKGSRSVRVAVIDRGPYVGGREYDLTQATAQRLGFTGHGALLVTR